jgi:hypothetical protein
MRAIMSSQRHVRQQIFQGAAVGHSDARVVWRDIPPADA